MQILYYVNIKIFAFLTASDNAKCAIILHDIEKLWNETFKLFKYLLTISQWTTYVQDVNIIWHLFIPSVARDSLNYILRYLKCFELFSMSGKLEGAF